MQGTLPLDGISKVGYLHRGRWGGTQLQCGRQRRRSAVCSCNNGLYFTTSDTYGGITMNDDFWLREGRKVTPINGTTLSEGGTRVCAKSYYEWVRE
jgi:hypothetical protein